MVQLFELLDTVSQRVLSDNDSSNTPTIEPCKAGIDKLNGYFTNSIHVSKIAEIVLLNGLNSKKVFLKDRFAYLEISKQNEIIHLKLDKTQSFITGFVANPNHFISWDKFLYFFKTATAIQSFHECRISRLDLNIDYPINFQTLISKLDITNKRASLSFIDEGGERTGLIIGKGNETIAIYDKAKKSKIDTPLTRIEIRLKQNKLPTKNIEDVSQSLEKRDFFQSIGLVNLTYGTPHLTDQKERLNRFKSICEREGYFLARKSENRTRNFDRDFKNLITITQYPAQPNEHFKRHIGGYINPKKGEEYV